MSFHTPGLTLSKDTDLTFATLSGQTLKMTYSSAPITVPFDGFLFDMDGTIIDSTPAVEKHWQV